MAKEPVREKQNGVPETWVDSLGRKRQHTGVLQHEGRPNDEPPPEIPVEEQFKPGDGSLPPADDLSHLLEPGQVNPEPEPEIDEPFMHGYEAENNVKPAGAAMIVENPDSLLPETPGVVERGNAKHPRVARRNEPADEPVKSSDDRLAGQVGGEERLSGAKAVPAVQTKAEKREARGKGRGRAKK